MRWPITAIRAVIAPSFGDIFASNAVKNGVLPARDREADAEALLAAAGLVADRRMTVDLAAQTITAGNLVVLLRDRSGLEEAVAERLGRHRHDAQRSPGHCALHRTGRASASVDEAGGRDRVAVAAHRALLRVPS